MIQNNMPPVQGKAAILAGLSQFWQSFSKLTHDLLNIYGNDDAFALEALNHYVRLDGETVTVRAVALTDRNATGLVTRFSFLHRCKPGLCERSAQGLKGDSMRVLVTGPTDTNTKLTDTERFDVGQQLNALQFRFEALGSPARGLSQERGTHSS